jgi:CRISPR/Cas system endoribonuclease Cas6 (RAMP superfamily)
MFTNLLLYSRLFKNSKYRENLKNNLKKRFGHGYHVAVMLECSKAFKFITLKYEDFDTIASSEDN